MTSSDELDHFRFTESHPGKRLYVRFRTLLWEGEESFSGWGRSITATSMERDDRTST